MADEVSHTNFVHDVLLILVSDGIAFAWAQILKLVSSFDCRW
ncbi:MAG TPA: hypothetical protein VGU67_04185 [Edaphobacter sp.]|nr:hypothetical protein [Edaphobacter sp.]